MNSARTNRPATQHDDAGRRRGRRRFMTLFSLLALSARFGAEPALAAEAAPALLIFTRDNCPYCLRLMREQVAPLRRNADFAWLKIIEVSMTGEELLLLPDGRRANGRALARAYDVRLAPTVVFLDPRGDVAATTLVGYTSPDFYSFYFDQRVELLAASRAEVGRSASPRLP